MMNVIGVIFFFICLSFLIVIFAAIVFAIYLKTRMAVFKEVQAENEAYHHEPYKDADFDAIGRDEDADPAEIVDADYRVLSAEGHAEEPNS